MRSEGKFVPRTLSASEYVRELFGPDDNAAILVRNRSTGHTVQTISKAATIAGTPFQSWLAGQNASGYDVFAGMNPIKDGAFSRTKQNIQEIRHVYLDLDRKADQALEAIRNSAEVPAPNFVLDTSPGKHQVVWNVSGFSQDEAESLLHNLASKFGGDLAATDSTRVLRLPGFANHKLSEQFIVQARQETDAVYTPRDFLIHDDFPEMPRHLGRGQGHSPSVPTEHKSQSERDWAYARRALARGDHPDAVIRRIADYRADDKHDPEYYARLTVAKAQESLRRKRLRTETKTEEPGRGPERSFGV
jgi:hypothetical protein